MALDSVERTVHFIIHHLSFYHSCTIYMALSTGIILSIIGLVVGCLALLPCIWKLLRTWARARKENRCNIPSKLNRTWSLQ